jgi:hemin uptake protein HemP
MAIDTTPGSATPEQQGRTAQTAQEPVMRLQSRELFRLGREVEIDHEGRIYRLRLTQLNKLILTA